MRCSPTGAQAHADVLEDPAEAGGLVALEVGHHHQGIGVHHRRADAHRVEVRGAAMGTSTPSRPSSPSAMMMGASTVANAKPL